MSTSRGSVMNGSEDSWGVATGLFAASSASSERFAIASDPRARSIGVVEAGSGRGIVDDGITGLSTCSFFFLIKKSLNEVLTF